MANKKRKTDQKRRRFSRDFKLDAIRLVKEGGMKANEVNKHLGLNQYMVERWINEHDSDPRESFPGVGQPKESEKELYELKRKLKETEEERDILKKALSIFSRQKK